MTPNRKWDHRSIMNVASICSSLPPAHDLLGNLAIGLKQTLGGVVKDRAGLRRTRSNRPSEGSGASGQSEGSDLSAGLQQYAVVDKKASNGVAATGSLARTQSFGGGLKVGNLFSHQPASLDADLGVPARLLEQACL